jgi:hypothetical protein
MIRMPNAIGTAECRLVERPRGEILNAETGQPFRFTDACVSRGTTVGYDPEAYRDAVDRVRAFLRQHLD